MLVTEVRPNVKGVGKVTMPVKVGDAVVANVPLVGKVRVVFPVVVKNKLLTAVLKGITPFAPKSGSV